jgi:hypothetical protein
MIAALRDRRGRARSATGFKLETSPRLPVPAAHAPTSTPPAHPPPTAPGPRSKRWSKLGSAPLPPAPDRWSKLSPAPPPPVPGRRSVPSRWSVPARRSKLDLLGKILCQVIHLAGEIFLEGNRCGLDRSRQQACAQAAGHGTKQNAFKRIAAVRSRLSNGIGSSEFRRKHPFVAGNVSKRL